MAFTDWSPANMTLNRARTLCDRAIARYAPVWLGPTGLPINVNPEGPNAFAYANEPFDADDVPAEFLADTNDEPDYMQGLSEREKAQVRLVGSDESRSQYAHDLKEWHAKTD